MFLRNQKIIQRKTPKKTAKKTANRRKKDITNSDESSQDEPPRNASQTSTPVKNGKTRSIDSSEHSIEKEHSIELRLEEDEEEDKEEEEKEEEEKEEEEKGTLP